MTLVLKKKIILLLLVMSMLYNIAYCMDNDFYFNGVNYSSFDTLIKAKQTIFFKALVLEDSIVLSRDFHEIKDLFYEKLFNSNLSLTQQHSRKCFNDFLNQQNSVEDITKLASIFYKSYFLT